MRWSAHQSTQVPWGDGGAAWASTHLGVWVLIFFLAILNWGIEAAKWQGLIAHVETMGFIRAFSATLAGTTMGSITPNRTGEFMGRVLLLAPEHRVQGGLATLLGSMAQFVVTIVLGGAAFVWWWAIPVQGEAFDAWSAWAILVLVVGIAAGALIIYFSPSTLRRWILWLPFLRRWQVQVDVLAKYRTKELRDVLALSAARYAVFTFQFVLLLAIVAEVPWEQAWMAVPLIFLTTTLVPSMMLADLGIRGSVAVALLVPAGDAAAPVLLAAFMLWIVNLALPALIGGIILLFTHIRTKR